MFGKNLFHALAAIFGGPVITADGSGVSADPTETMFLPGSAYSKPLPVHRTGGARAHKAWKRKRATGRA